MDLECVNGAELSLLYSEITKQQNTCRLNTSLTLNAVVLKINLWTYKKKILKISSLSKKIADTGS